MAKPACTVIVATYNRSKLLARFFDYLDKQDISPDGFEVVVVDDGSKDDTQALLANRDFEYRVRVIKQVNQGPAAARNAAIGIAEADLLVSLDDDVMPAPDLLRRHLAAHEANDHLAAMGVMILPPGKRLEPWLEWEAVALEKQYAAMRQGRWSATPRQFYTANASFRKQYAIDAGLFDTDYRRAEDVELAYRMSDLGVTFQFLPDAVVHHEPNRTYAQWLKVPRLYGMYDVRMWQDKDRRQIINYVTNEFKQRPRPLQLAAKALVGRKLIYEPSIFFAGKAAAIAGARQPRLSLGLYSVIFNLQYWQGFAEAISGRQTFWRYLDDPAAANEQIRRQPALNTP